MTFSRLCLKSCSVRARRSIGYQNILQIYTHLLSVFRPVAVFLPTNDKLVHLFLLAGIFGSDEQRRYLGHSFFRLILPNLPMSFENVGTFPTQVQGLPSFTNRYQIKHIQYSTDKSQQNWLQFVKKECCIISFSLLFLMNSLQGISGDLHGKRTGHDTNIDCRIRKCLP